MKRGEVCLEGGGGMSQNPLLFLRVLLAGDCWGGGVSCDTCCFCVNGLEGVFGLGAGVCASWVGGSSTLDAPVLWELFDLLKAEFLGGCLGSDFFLCMKTGSGLSGLSFSGTVFSMGCLGFFLHCLAMWPLSPQLKHLIISLEMKIR